MMKQLNRLAIMQPTFLPWAGYFNLIANSDNFIFLDDAQLEKQSWQTRNKLIICGEVKWISIPVRHLSLSQTIGETQLINSPIWRNKLSRGFFINYGGHPHYSSAKEILDLVVAGEYSSLGDLNEAIIKFIAQKLDLKVKFHKSSEMQIKGRRSDKLLALCECFSPEEYLSPLGSSEYLLSDHFSEKCSFKLKFQNFSPGPYSQGRLNCYHSHLSIVDVVANLGWINSKIYIETGIA